MVQPIIFDEYARSTRSRLDVAVKDISATTDLNIICGCSESYVIGVALVSLIDLLDVDCDRGSVYIIH